VRSTLLVVALLVAAPVVAGKTEASRPTGHLVLPSHPIQPAAPATAQLSESAAVCAADLATVLPVERASATATPNVCGDVTQHAADTIHAPSDRSEGGVITLASASCDYCYDKCLNATDNNQGLAACILYLWYCG
jgi:hypothetical protein